MSVGPCSTHLQTEGLSPIVAFEYFVRAEFNVRSAIVLPADINRRTPKSPVPLSTVNRDEISFIQQSGHRDLPVVRVSGAAPRELSSDYLADLPDISLLWLAVSMTIQVSRRLDGRWVLGGRSAGDIKRLEPAIYSSRFSECILG